MWQKNKERNILLIIERNNFKRDLGFINILAQTISARGYKIKWHSPSGANILFILDPQGKLSAFPSPVRKLIKGLLLIAKPYLWKHFVRRYFFKAHTPPQKTITERCEGLKHYIEKLGKGANVSILSRSAGGQVASMIADEVAIKKLICLGYPFKHPDKPIDPERFKHLETLKTPFLIIQGNTDMYGGAEIMDTYAFSPQVSVELVNTGHDFRISPAQWEVVTDRIKAFLAE